MLGRCRLYLSLAALFLSAAAAAAGSSNGTCPYDLLSATGLISTACYANSTSVGPINCCWSVYTAYAFAVVRYANLTGSAFLPPDNATACSAAFAGILVDGGFVKASLLSSATCDLGPSSIASAGGPCHFPTAAGIHSTFNFSRASSLCAAPAVGDLSADTATAKCSACQNAVITATFGLLNATHTKEFVPCGMAATIGTWSPFQPSPSRFGSFARCMLQVLENVGALGTDNLIPSPPPPSAVKSPASIPNPSPSSSSTSRSIKIALASASAGLVSVAAIIFLAFKIRLPRAISNPDADDKDLPPTSSSPSPLPTDGLYIFTKAELIAATNGFDDSLLIGQGGAGKVYLGKLPSGQRVAIKRIYIERKRAEFYAEVGILAKLRHRNLTTLVGYCLGEREHTLVYEYMAGGNLARALFSGELTWQRRMQVALDVAEGLAYLHGHPEGAIVHRDVKPTNVLLSETGLAKLSDFGVSRVVPPGGGHVSTELMGTVGYVDPETFPAGHVSEATDVYSFGVVLLELVTGMQAVVPTPTGGAQSIIHAASASGGGSSSSEAEPPVVDSRLGEDWDRPTVGVVFGLACRCVRLRKGERPTMREVASALAGELAGLEARTGLAADDASSPPPLRAGSPAPPSASTASTPSMHGWSL